MPYNRLGQITGEMQSTEEVLQRPIYTTTNSGVIAASGDRSWKHSIRSTIGIGFAEIPAARAACHFLIASGFYGSGVSYPLYFTARDVSIGPAHGVKITADAATIELYVDGVIIESKSFSEAGISEDEWFHLAAGFNGPGEEFFVWTQAAPLFTYVGNAFTSENVNGAWSGNLATTYATTYTDNLYVDECDGVPVSIRPPIKHFLYKPANNDGVFSDWSPVGVANNYQAIDEVPHNSDTDYNGASSGGLIDTFETDAAYVPYDTDEKVFILRAVLPVVMAKRNRMDQDAAVRMLAYDGATFVQGIDHEYIGPGYQMYWDRFEQQPDGSSWTENDLNIMEFGYESRGTFA